MIDFVMLLQYEGNALVVAGSSAESHRRGVVTFGIPLPRWSRPLHGPGHLRPA